MKKITKSLIALALCAFGVMGANAQVKTCATFANPSKTNAEWHSGTSSFTWGAPTWNQIHNIGLLEDESGPSDISLLKTLIIDYEIISGSGFRVLFYQGGSNIPLYVNADGAYRDAACTDLVAESVDNVVEIPIYDFLSNATGYDTGYIFSLTDICLSGWNGSGEVQINEMCVETYGPNDTLPSIIADEEEQDPGKPEGDYIDFTEAFPDVTPALGAKKGQGEIIVGAKSQNVVADLSDYSEMTIVATPGLKLVVYMNHTIDPKETADGYTEDEAGLYDFIEIQADENGLAVVDLTEYTDQDLNCIALPWDNSNKGTVWYILLTAGEGDPLKPLKKDLESAIAAGMDINPIGKTEASLEALLSALLDGDDVLENATTEAELTTATDNILEAIENLKLQAGYANLTPDMFLRWDFAELPVIGEKTGCLYVLNESTGQPYGDGSVYYLNYANLSDFDKLIVAGTSGTPRIMMNRTEPVLKEGSETEYVDANGGDYVQITDEFNDDGYVEVDLTEYPYAHLNAIKGANWQNVTVTDMLVYAAGSTITIGDAGYASYSGVMNVDVSENDDITAYGVKYVDGQLTLTPINTIPANEAVIVKDEMPGEGIGIFLLPNVETAEPISNDLVISDGSVTSDDYIEVYALGEIDGVVGFYRVQAGVKVPAGKAYFGLAAGIEAREFIPLEGAATGISTVATAQSMKSNEIFNLAGQRVAKAQKGLYIQNGKKFVK